MRTAGIAHASCSALVAALAIATLMCCVTEVDGTNAPEFIFPAGTISAVYKSYFMPVCIHLYPLALLF